MVHVLPLRWNFILQNVHMVQVAEGMSPRVARGSITSKAEFCTSTDAKETHWKS